MQLDGVYADMSPYGFVYGLHDPETDELRYIGQTTCSLKKRLWSHIGPTNRKKPNYSSRWINSLVEKGLRPEIRLRATAFSQVELDQLEMDHIAQARTDGVRLTNHTEGGMGQKGRRHTPEWRVRMSALKAGINTNTTEHIERLRQMKMGVPRSEETKARISQAKCGTKLSEEHKAKIAASMTGKDQSHITRHNGSSHHQFRHDISTKYILQRVAEGTSKVSLAEELGVSSTFIHRRLNQARRAGA